MPDGVASPLAERIAGCLAAREPQLMREALACDHRLFSFAHLSDCLNTRLVLPPQLRIFREGKEISPREYLEAYRGGRRSVMADRLEAILARGATMVVNNFDDLTPGVRDLACGLERATGLGVGCNLYASWPPVAGFDVHYDQHDVAVLQVEGTKTWHLYDQPERFPAASAVLGGYRERAPSRSLTLQVGDVLFLPRGYVHAAVAEECCSVHLSVSFEVVGARQLIEEAVARALRERGLEGDLVALDEAGREALVRRARESLSSSMSAASVDAFMRERVGRPRRPAPVELSAVLGAPAGMSSHRDGAVE